MLIVDIAAADAGDGVFVQIEAAADFGNFFAVHRRPRVSRRGAVDILIFYYIISVGRFFDGKRTFR